jgi:hypothetical protein
MNLSELTRYYPFDNNVLDIAQKTVPYNNTGDLIYKLKQSGWNKIGNPSSYSDIFANDSKPYILKINRTQDKGFAWFAFLTRKFPNPHFPKIGNMKVITGPQRHTMRGSALPREKFYIYLIEKLEEISYRSDYDWRDNIYDCKKYIAGELSLDELQRELSSSALREQSFIDALTILTNNNKGFRADLHYENIMQRQNGTLVIIDPYAD